MDKLLGYDCDGNEIYEYRILRAIFSNDISIEQLEDADARQYCAVMGNDEKVYAISVYDWWNKELIRARENISEEEVPIIVRPIDEMINYEVAMCNGGQKEFYYDLDRNELKDKLNMILEKDLKKKVKKYEKNRYNICVK